MSKLVPYVGIAVAVAIGVAAAPVVGPLVALAAVGVLVFVGVLLAYGLLIRAVAMVLAAGVDVVTLLRGVRRGTYALMGAACGCAAAALAERSRTSAFDQGIAAGADVALIFLVVVIMVRLGTPTSADSRIAP